MDPRDQTFMTIHNLTPDANILFASDSVQDILGYQPQEVQGKSCFDYFHPDEVPFARSVHNRGVLLDKAAVLHYARILSKNGTWVSCECCFTIVHDVLVACTSIYYGGEKSERRAMEAPQIRRIFSSSPRDPRYHMLEHLSPRFKMPPMEREPRAALILNRFTRNLSIMFSTNAVTQILGITPEEIKDKPFYECIQENCLRDAIQVLESAKANESIAYLRFWFRDPRGEEEPEDDAAEAEEEERLSSSNSDSEGGGVHLDSRMDVDDSVIEIKDDSGENTDDSRPRPSTSTSSITNVGPATAFPSAGTSAYQTPLTSQSSAVAAQSRMSPHPQPARRRPRREPFELEAVVSCTSDGLVVVLRKARPPIPTPQPPLPSPSLFNYENGLFAAPWGHRPIEPYFPPEMLYQFRPPLLPQYMPLRENVKAAGGPPLDQLMRSIRDVAVFAWALVGINGNLANYGRGMPRRGAQPRDGLPIWDPNAGPTEYPGPENRATERWARYMQTEHDKASVSTSGHAYNHERAFSFAEPASHNYSAAPPAPLDNYTYASQQHNSSTWSRSTASYGSIPNHEQGPRLPSSQTYTQGHDAQLHQPSPAGPGSFHGPPREPWADTPTSQAYGANYAIPTTQASGLGDPFHGSRYAWQ